MQSFWSSFHSLSEEESLPSVPVRRRGRKAGYTCPPMSHSILKTFHTWLSGRSGGVAGGQLRSPPHPPPPPYARVRDLQPEARLCARHAPSSHAGKDHHTFLLCVPPSGITHPDHIQSVYGAILYVASDDTLYYARFGSLNTVGGDTSSLTAVRACLGHAAHDLPLCCVLNSYDILAERCAGEAQKFGRARAISSASIKPNGFKHSFVPEQFGRSFAMARQLGTSVLCVVDAVGTSLASQRAHLVVS